MLGLEPCPRAVSTGRPSRVSCNVPVIGWKSRFQSPGLYVTGNFYVPRGQLGLSPRSSTCAATASIRTGPRPSIGSGPSGIRPTATACSPSTPSSSGRSGIHHGTHNLSLWNWLSSATPPPVSGVERHARPSIGCPHARKWIPNASASPGSPGGRAITWYLTALDDRVAAALPRVPPSPTAPPGCTGSRGSQCVASITECLRLGFSVVAALVAPRPAHHQRSSGTPFFPPDGYHEVYQRARRIYELLGAPERIRGLDDDVRPQRSTAISQRKPRWMIVGSKGDLAVTGTNSPRPRILGTGGPEQHPRGCRPSRPPRIHAIPSPAHPDSPEAGSAGGRTAGAAARPGVPLVPARELAILRPTGSEGPAGWAGRYADGRQVTFETEPGVRLYAQVFSAATNVTGAPLVIRVKDPGRMYTAVTSTKSLRCWAGATSSSYNPASPRPISTPPGIHRHRAHGRLAPDAPSLACRSGMSCGRWNGSPPRTSPPGKIILYGRRDQGAVVLHAALLDSRIHEVVLIDPPASPLARSALLNVLGRDLARVAAALAPRRITLLSPFPQGSEFAGRLQTARYRRRRIPPGTQLQTVFTKVPIAGFQRHPLEDHRGDRPALAKERPPHENPDESSIRTHAFFPSAVPPPGSAHFRIRGPPVSSSRGSPGFPLARAAAPPGPFQGCLPLPYAFDAMEPYIDAKDDNPSRQTPRRVRRQPEQGGRGLSGSPEDVHRGTGSESRQGA